MYLGSSWVSSPKRTVKRIIVIQVEARIEPHNAIRPGVLHVRVATNVSLRDGHDCATVYRNVLDVRDGTGVRRAERHDRVVCSELQTGDGRRGNGPIRNAKKTRERYAKCGIRYPNLNRAEIVARFAICCGS